MINTVHTPSLIDANGNINVHGRSGIYLAFKLFTDASQASQIDISESSLVFEVDGILSEPLVADPDDAKGLLVIVGDLEEAGLLIVPPNFPLYCIRDDTTSNKEVRAQGLLIIYGFESAPA